MKMMWLFLVLVAGTISTGVYAGGDLNNYQIRQLVKRGEILSLDDILLKHQQLSQGRLLDLEVESEHGQIISELEFLRQNGDVVEFKMDAASGDILEQEIEH